MAHLLKLLCVVINASLARAMPLTGPSSRRSLYHLTDGIASLRRWSNILQ